MQQLFKILLTLVITSISLLANESIGTLSVVLFSDGSPLPSNEIRINGKKSFTTDEDGSVEIALVVGNHQIEIFAKDTQGLALGYFKKQITIKYDRDTLVIATLKKEGDNKINIDTPIDTTSAKNIHNDKLAYTGELTGKVLSIEGSAISGARIFVKGTSLDIRTDENGYYTAMVPAGKLLSVSVVHSEYIAQTLQSIQVPANKSISRVIKLSPTSIELEEFIVLAPKIEGSISTVINEEKNINAIANIIGSEEFSKKGDSSVADALKRVPGITVVGGRGVYVRGLGDRYSNVALNSLPIPSPDLTRRIVPLDIFPSSMISSMKVQKSGRADIPANFGGGYIDMKTKNKNEKDYLKIGFGLNANSNVGQDILTYTGSSTDWLGYDDGYRDIPADILKHAEVVVGERIKSFSIAEVGNGDRDLGRKRLLQMTQDLVQRDYGIYTQPMPFGGSFNVEGLKNFEINDDNKISVFANYSYGQEHTYREETFFSYLYDANNLPSSLLADGTKNIATSEFTQSAMLNVDYTFSDVFHVKYTKLFTHVGEKTTRSTQGVFGADIWYVYYDYLEWNERTLITDQLSGEFDYELFHTENTFTFGMEYATAKFDQPNNLLTQDIRLGDTPADHTRRYFIDTQNHLSQKMLSDDTVMALNIDNKTQYDIFSDEDYVQIGFSHSNKDRVSEFQRFYLHRKGSPRVPSYTALPGGDPEALLDKYVRNETDYNQLPFSVRSLFDSSDFFDAEVVQSDAFVNVFVEPFEGLEIMGGARYVNLTQTLFEYIENRQDNRKITKRENEIYVDDFFPSLSVKYEHDEANVFDFAVSNTFIMPDLREFSESFYFHPYEVAMVSGNPDLVNTMIYSVDLKYSHFFSSTEYVKAGIFYKHMDKPIEDTEIMSGSIPIFSFVNSDFATLYGLELDARKSLDFLGGGIIPYLGHTSNYYVSANFSFTESEVRLQEEQVGLLTTNNRQLQGLSKMVTNISTGYDDRDRSAVLSYNHMGDRIRRVGIVNALGIRFGDTIESPPVVLDFMWVEKFSDDFTAKMRIGNILDGKTVWVRDKKEIRYFKTGQTFDFSVSYIF